MKVSKFLSGTPHSPPEGKPSAYIEVALTEKSLLLLHRIASSDRCAVVAPVALDKTEN